MHDDHDHDHHHRHGYGRAPGVGAGLASGAGDFDPLAVGRPPGKQGPGEPGFDRQPAGHNRVGTAQWQTPHAPGEDGTPAEPTEPEPDIDLVEKAFVESFVKASDPVSFLRLAGIPLVGRDRAGRELRLLRVAQENRVDVGSLSPQLGGSGFRYDPLPAAMTSMRERLAFIYFDGDDTCALTFGEARGLQPALT